MIRHRCYMRPLIIPRESATDVLKFDSFIKLNILYAFFNYEKRAEDQNKILSIVCSLLWGLDYKK